MNFHRLARLLAAAFALVPCAALAQDTRVASRVPDIDELLSLERIGGVALSPQAKYIAYTVRQTNWKDNEFASQIWLVNVATGSSFQLTRGKKSPGHMEWSPDGRWLAFTAERESSAIDPLEKKSDATGAPGDKEKEKDKAGSDGKPAALQIWLISPEGGEAWQLTKSESDVEGFSWSKDGKSIAFTANDPQSKAAKDRKDKYSDFEVYEKDYQQNQLWLADVSFAERKFLPVVARKLSSDPSLNIGSFSWSPDSRRIAFSAAQNPLLAFSGERDIYLVDLSAANAVKKIVAIPGPDDSPIFSPDGNQLVFSSSLGDPYFYYTNNHIVVADVDALLARPAASRADVREIAGKFDEDIDLLDWGPGGIYFDAMQKTRAAMFVLNPATQEIQRLTSPDSLIINGVSLSKDCSSAAFTAADPSHMGELYFTSLAPYAPRKLTDFTAQVAGLKLGSAEVVSWKSKDGATIEGILHKPADYDPSRKYPLLVIIHGGPTGISVPALSPDKYAYPMHLWLAKGALVLEPNYRGSAGYGGAFRALNVRNLGVGDMWDVMSGVDSLIAKGIADPGKLGAMGWSQGGYISAFLTTHTDRFKAISVGAGISDWMTYYVNTDITPFTRQYLHATPWNDPEIYAKTSPITTIKDAKTPTLIQQGSNDKRVPVPDSFELYRGLQDQGVASRLILYNGFGHGINKPKSQRALLQANLDWFNFYIWGEAIPKDSPLYGSGEQPPAGK